MEIDNPIMLVVLFIVLLIQIPLSLDKRPLLGLIPVILSATQVIYWLGNPIPEGHLPTMTVLNSFPWMAVTGVYLIIYFICRIKVKNNNNY